MSNRIAQLRLRPAPARVIAIPAFLCLGCGEDLTNRASDGRALQGPPAEEVVDAWKAVFENVQVDVDEEERLCVDTLLAGVEVPGKNCVGSVFRDTRGSPSCTRRCTTMLLERLKANSAKNHS